MLKRIFMNEWMIVSIILANSVVLFLMGYREFSGYRPFEIADHFFTFFFIGEILVKVRFYGWKNYISSAWNKLDFILVAISIPSLFELLIDIPDISFLLVFRLLRVLRILRFLRFIPNIKQMIAGIQRAFRASIFVFLALFIYNILLAVLSSYLFRDDAPDLFGNPMLSMYSIFQIFTLEGWNEIPQRVIENLDPDSWVPGLTRLYFLIVVLTGSIFGFSIVNAIFVDEMVMDNNDGLEAKVDELNEKINKLLADRNINPND
ncbi:MAG: ion transporter [Cyclobacteriaceae bacterium]|nr:ion transporter [Cyclobacteriaceae bacterium]